MSIGITIQLLGFLQLYSMVLTFLRNYALLFSKRKPALHASLDCDTISGSFSFCIVAWCVWLTARLGSLCVSRANALPFHVLFTAA